MHGATIKKNLTLSLSFASIIFFTSSLTVSCVFRFPYHRVLLRLPVFCFFLLLLLLLQVGYEPDLQQLTAYRLSDFQDRYFAKYSTVMRHITTFRSTTDRIYDGGPIRL